MKVLITGATGFIASHLIEFLLEKDVEIFGTKRWRSPLNNIKKTAKNINLVDCELRDAFSVQKAVNDVKPDMIFHLAAQSFVPAGLTQPNNTIDTNVNGTVNLLEAVKLAKIDPLIHVCSTSDVYGGFEKEKTVTELDLPNPCNLYAVSKLGEEKVGKQYNTSFGLKTIMTRACIKTGPRRGHVFVESAFARQIAEIEAGIKKPVMKVGNLKSIRTFLDVRDAVRAYWLLVKKCKPGDVYNISSDITITIKELLDRLLSLSESGKDIKVETDPKLLRPSDTMLPRFNCDKFKKETGWKQEIPFEKTLKDLLDFWREEIKEQN
jgi:GDP-mannose 4,6-dehydratase